MAESPETESSIASNGDIIFAVGTEKKQFTVHSIVIRLNSTVFEAMLHPYFKEGRNLAGEYPILIPLPEDDPDAISIVFDTIHGQNDMITKVPTAEQVLQLAIISDKYKMNKALKYAAKQWLDPGTNVDSKVLWSLSMAAYLFNDSERFRYLTLKLILNHHGSYRNLMLKHDSIKTEVLTNVCCLLEERRNELQMEIYRKAIDKLVYGTGLCSCGFYDQYASSRLSILNNKLKPKIISCKNISDMISAMKEMPEPVANSAFKLSYSCPSHNSLPSLRDTINRDFTDWIAIQRGLCLTCLQTNNSLSCKH